MACATSRKGAKLRLRFDVEAENPGLEREGHFRARLADAGKCDASGRRSGGQRAAQFAFRDDVHAGAEPRQGRQHSLVGIGLHGIADERVEAAERRPEHFVVAGQRRAGIAIERRPDRVREGGKIDILGMHDAVPDCEMMHGPNVREGMSEQGIERKRFLRRLCRRRDRADRRAAGIRGCRRRGGVDWRRLGVRGQGGARDVGQRRIRRRAPGGGSSGPRRPQPARHRAVTRTKAAQRVERKQVTKRLRRGPLL